MIRPIVAKDLDVPETSTGAPFLVTLGFDASTFERLDRLRDRYFPASLNQVPAHLCLFHHLPGDEGEAIACALGEVARSSPALELRFPILKRMARGLMLPVEAPGLLAIHATLARPFVGWLTPQDRQPFRPHVTIMNKADRPAVEAAWDELAPCWPSPTGTGDRLILWRYLGGPWVEVGAYPLSAVPDEIGRKPSSMRRER